MKKSENVNNAADGSVESSDLLAAFGSMVLDDLLQGEWEPDAEWQDAMLELAKSHGMLSIRPATEEDDPEEYDFMWVRESPVIRFPANDQGHQSHPSKD
jgi:hypothetical protein